MIKYRKKRIRKKYLSICKYHSRRKCLEKSCFLTVSIIMAPFSLDPERFKGRRFQVMNYSHFSMYLFFSFKEMSSLVFELTFFAFLIWILSVRRFQFVKRYVYWYFDRNIKISRKPYFQTKRMKGGCLVHFCGWFFYGRGGTKLVVFCECHKCLPTNKKTKVLWFLARWRNW